MDPDEDASSGDDMIPYDELLRQIDEHPDAAPSQRARAERRNAVQQASKAEFASAQRQVQLPPEHTHSSGLVQRAWTETGGHVEKIARAYPELTPEKIREIDAAVDEIFAFTMLPRGFEEGMDIRRLDVGCSVSLSVPAVCNSFPAPNDGCSHPESSTGAHLCFPA